MDNLKWIKETEDLKLTGPIPDSKKMLYSFEESCMDGSFRKRKMQLKGLPFLLPSNEEKAIISRDVQVDSDKLKNEIKLFQEWLKCENYLPDDVDETLIRNFLYGCKGNLETAKGKFEKYMVNRTKLTLLYEERQGDRNAIEAWGTHRILWISPKLTPQGYRVLFLRCPTSDSTYLNSIEIYKRLLLQIDLHLFTDENAGYELAIDARNITMAIMSKVNLRLTHHFLRILFTIVPFRIKNIYITNTSPGMDVIMNMVVKMISKKLKERIHYVKVEELKTYLPLECLPSDYGGNAGVYDDHGDEYHAFLAKNLEWIKDIENLKLTGPIPDNKKMLYSFEESSMDGSFRKLNID